MSKKQKVIVESQVMTRSELIQIIADRFPQLNKTDCDVAVKEIMDAISEALANGNRESRMSMAYVLRVASVRGYRHPLGMAL